MPAVDPTRRFMARALSLAKRGAGRVSPNPMVGCVVARGERIVAEGYHLYDRLDHAEVVALARAGELARGADLYVNLEPCSHHGRTPPCVDRIVAAGVKRVFVSVPDPNPLVAGDGIEKLRENGVEVQVGPLASRATRLNEVFFHYIQKRTPFVLLKLAMTLDGKIATATGNSRWITGSRARDAGHRLRHDYDAILVGVGTIVEDDPSLDVRWRRRNRIQKIVLDTRLRTPSKAKIFDSGDPVVLFHGADAPAKRRGELAERALLVEVGTDRGGLSWPSLLTDLGARGVTSLLIEGGAKIAASALRAGVVQKVNFFYGPEIIGGRDLCGVADMGITDLGSAVRVRDIRLRGLAPDFLVEGWIEPETP